MKEGVVGRLSKVCINWEVVGRGRGKYKSSLKFL